MQGILDFGNFLLSIFVYQWTIYNNDLAAVVWYEDRSFPIPFFSSSTFVKLRMRMARMVCVQDSMWHDFSSR